MWARLLGKMQIIFIYYGIQLFKTKTPENGGHCMD